MAAAASMQIMAAVPKVVQVGIRQC